MREPHLIRKWRGIVKPEELSELSRDAGFCERKRKLTPYRLFWGLVLGFGTSSKKSLAGLARFICITGGLIVSRQAFHQRLTSEAADFFRRCFMRLSRRIANEVREALPGNLCSFEDLTLIDSTVLGLAKRLAKIYPACRTNSRKAALKVHAVMSLSGQHVESVLVTGERFADGKAVSPGKWVRDRLLLFDLGYLDYGFLRGILEFGGAFCCRLKTTSNAVITAVRKGCAGREVGGALNRLIYRGPVVDLDARFGEGRKALEMRVVGLWNIKSKEYHWYATSLKPEKFSAREVGDIYRLRWQIELLFKEWKSIMRLGDLPSGDENIVNCLIFATLCCSLISRIALWLAAQRYKLPWFKMSTPIAVTILATYGSELARNLLRRRADGFAKALSELVESMGVHAYQPNNANAITSYASNEA